MGNRIDYKGVVGSRFGKLTVIAKAGKTAKHGPEFLCQCDCGNQKIILGRSLITGAARSCGCEKHRHVDYSDIIGKRYGKLTVLGHVGLTKKNEKHNESSYLCQCDCGNKVLIPREQLIGDKRRSCGKCYRIFAEEEHFRYVCPDGRSFIFSKSDYETVTRKKWSISPFGYVLSSEDGKTIRLTTYLLRPGKGMIVDHINGDRLDNRRKNLRVASIADNNRNSGIQKNNRSGFKGVSLKQGKYEACVYADGKGIYLGRFSNPEDAARAYDTAARFLFGEFACVNFPLPGEQSCLRNQSNVLNATA